MRNLFPSHIVYSLIGLRRYQYLSADLSHINSAPVCPLSGVEFRLPRADSVAASDHHHSLIVLSERCGDHAATLFDFLLCPAPCHPCFGLLGG